MGKSIWHSSSHPQNQFGMGNTALHYPCKLQLAPAEVVRLCSWSSREALNEYLGPE